MFGQAQQSRFTDKYRRELAPLLKKFYKDFAKPIKCATLSDLRHVVGKILKRVRERDSRFQFQVHDVGSVASGVSAVVACEFDILLCLDIEGSDVESDLSPGFAKFKLSKSSIKQWRDVVDGPYLNPRKITETFQSHVDHVVREMQDDLGGEYYVGGQGTVATTVATTESDFKFKADLVLAVKCEGWPTSANPDWLQIGYHKEWPSAETISQIKQKASYELVAKYVNESTPGVGDEGPELELLWRISVSRAETMLFKTIDGPDDTLCHKKCLIIFKALRLHHLVRNGRGRIPESEITILMTSYHMKSLLFHEAQIHPPSEWTDDQLVHRFLSFLDSIYWRVSFEDLSPFFFPEVNLFRKRGIMFGGLWKKFFLRLHADPKAYIESIMPVDPSTKYLYSYY